MNQAHLASEQRGTAQGCGSQVAQHTTMAQRLDHSQGPQSDALTYCYLLPLQGFRPHSREDPGSQQDCGWECSLKKGQEPTGRPQPTARLPQDKLEDRAGQTHSSAW